MAENPTYFAAMLQRALFDCWQRIDFCGDIYKIPFLFGRTPKETSSAFSDSLSALQCPRTTNHFVTPGLRTSPPLPCHLFLDGRFHIHHKLAYILERSISSGCWTLLSWNSCLSLSFFLILLPWQKWALVLRHTAV